MVLLHISRIDSYVHEKRAVWQAGDSGCSKVEAEGTGCDTSCTQTERERERQIMTVRPFLVHRGINELDTAIKADWTRLSEEFAREYKLERRSEEADPNRYFSQLYNLKQGKTPIEQYVAQAVDLYRKCPEALKGLVGKSIHSIRISSSSTTQSSHRTA